MFQKIETPESKRRETYVVGHNSCIEKGHDTHRTRVELIFKKFIIFFHEQTLVTIYRYKSKIVKIFGFQHLLVHAVLTIFGVKEPIANIDPKFSNLSCRSLHILIIYPYKFICLRLENTSIVKRFVYHGLFGG